VHLRGRANILKRYLMHVAGFNLSLIMRRIFGVGTPRGLQGRLEALLGALRAFLICFRRLIGSDQSQTLSRGRASVAA
jgi:transposase